MAREKRSLSSLFMEYCLKPTAIAGFFMLVALLWTFLLQTVVAYPFVFLFFWAIMASAWFGGLIAGFLSIGMSYVLVVFFFIPPLYSFQIAKEARSFVVAYLLCAVAMTIVSSARKRVEVAIRSAKGELEQRVQERTAELQRSNLEISERELQLRLLTEAIPQQIWSADAEGHIEYCNGDLVDYTGKSAEGLRGGAFFSIFHPEDVGAVRQNWEAARAAATEFEAQARICSAQATFRWFLVRGIPQRTSDGSITRWYGVHVDIEEQQRAQQRLLTAQDLLSRSTRAMSMAEMAASIAHELNQPLTALVTHASACRRWLSAEPANLPKACAAADRMVRDSTRAGAVLNRVRALFSKSDYVREPTDLNRLIVELAGLLRSDAIRRGVSIRLSLGDNLPGVMLDPVQIKQVLLNLTTNAMDAMMDSAPPRIVEISSHTSGEGTVSVAVSDRGPGITPEMQARMFEPFFTTKTDGTGMGLAICRSIIEAHEGRIWATSSDQGAVLQFALKVGNDESRR